MLDAEFYAITGRRSLDVFKPAELEQAELVSTWGENPEAEAGLTATLALAEKMGG